MGRPKKYTPELFMKCITEFPMTTQEVIHAIEKKKGSAPTWNTADAYLRDLAEEGKINFIKKGQMNLWSRPATSPDQVGGGSTKGGKRKKTRKQ